MRNGGGVAWQIIPSSASVKLSKTEKKSMALLRAVIGSRKRLIAFSNSRLNMANAPEANAVNFCSTALNILPA